MIISVLFFTFPLSQQFVLSHVKWVAVTTFGRIRGGGARAEVPGCKRIEYSIQELHVGGKGLVP